MRTRAGWFVIGVCLMAAVAGAAYLVGRPWSKPQQRQQGARGPAPDAFAQMVAERLVKRHPDLRASVEREGRKYYLVVTPSKPASRAALDDLHRAASRSPKRRDSLIDDFIERAVARLRRPSTPPLEQARDHLLPMIKRKAFLIEYNQGKDREMTLPRIPLPNDLVICFVIDYPDHVRYVTIGDLHAWQRTVTDVKVRAIKNLEARTEGRPMSVSKSAHGDVYFYDQGDGYDAARILLLHRQRAAPNPIWRENLIVALPDRDLLVAAPASAVEAMRKLMPRIRQDVSSRENPLTDRLFVVRSWGIEAYELPPQVAPRAKPAAAGRAPRR